MNEQPRETGASDDGSARSEELFRTGREAEHAGRFDEARRAYELGLSYDPGRHDWQYRLGCVHLKQDHPELAEPCFRLAVGGDGTRAAYWANLGLALDRQGRREESIRAYRTAARQPGGSAVACHNLGSIYAEEGRTAEAIRSFEEAIELEPDAEGWLNLGLVHFAGEDYIRAMDCFQRSVECDGRYALGHYYAGLCLMKRGIYEEAIGRFEKAWRLDSRLARIPFHLGACQHKLQRYAEAKISLETAVEFFPEDGKLHYQLALTCDAMGLPQEARLHYARARAAERPRDRA